MDIFLTGRNKEIQNLPGVFCSALLHSNRPVFVFHFCKYRKIPGRKLDGRIRLNLLVASRQPGKRAASMINLLCLRDVCYFYHRRCIRVSWFTLRDFSLPFPWQSARVYQGKCRFGCADNTYESRVCDFQLT